MLEANGNATVGAPSSSKYLTFNPGLMKEGISAIDASVLDREPDDTDGVKMPLQYKWHIWEQVATNNNTDYSNNTKTIASFSNVSDFWSLWNSLPQPSELMDNKRMVREVDGSHQLVDAIMIFREGIRPMWEDPMNTKGGHLEFKFMSSKGRQGGDDGIKAEGQLDECWNNLVLGMIGGSIEPAKMITGVRLVDKLTGIRPFLRLEVWFTDYSNADMRTELKKNVERTMVTKLDGSMGPSVSAEVKSHKGK